MTQQKTILLVDDDEDMLRLLNRILVKADFNVKYATTAAAARKLAEEDPPHIIISDLNMSPEDGFSFIKSIRSQKRYEDTPILVLSALNDFDAVKRVIALGISDYVIKPVEGPMLLRKVRKALHNKEFLKWEVPSSTTIILDVELDAEITALGDKGYHLLGPFKITPGQEVKLITPEFESQVIKNYHHVSSPLMKLYVSEGKFQNDIHFVSINQNGSIEIRQLIDKWTKT